MIGNHRLGSALHKQAGEWLTKYSVCGDRTAVQSWAEPVHALFRGAVSERLPAGLHFLQTVVAYRPLRFVSKMFLLLSCVAATTLLSSGILVFAQQVPSVARQPPQADSADQKPPDVINDHLPPWLAFHGEIRLRGEGFTGGGFTPDRRDAYLLTRLRLSMNMRPKSWFQFFVEGQDSRILGARSTAAVAPIQDTFRLAIATIELGNLENRGFGVRIGRQDLLFGEQRLVGNANWLNTPNNFDGVRGAIRGDSYHLDAFAACIVKAYPHEFDRCLPGNDIYGLYSGFSRLVSGATIEPYFFWRRQSGLISEGGQLGILHEGTIGLRWVGKFSLGLDYDTEIAKQIGSLGHDSISAWAGHWLLAYTLSRAPFTPRLLAEFNYASGDGNPTDGKRNTFDQLYPSAHDLYGLADQVGWKNIEHARTGVEFKPKAKWTVSSKYSSYWLANSHDALYNTSSAVVARSPTGRAGRYVGQELDFVTSLIYRQTTFSAGFGHIFPGTFLKITTRGASHSYPYGSVTYDF
jgi:hypothetical protein